MRYYPAALALSLAVAVSASMGQAGDYQADPRAAALVTEGRALLEAGETQGAIDAFEAALAIDPGYSEVYLDLADASRAVGLQGKAIHYYREALEREPGNLAALTGEGEALVERGALEKARQNLAKLETMCGEGCVETRELAAAIEAGPSPQVLTAEAVTPDPMVTQN
ncbi:MAG TPA: tetratricopeptide repeat protein [Sphingomonadaceae bacterium]|nr:tetratricopeptide repeat protein [Sphingomonadaceae bacterium]